MKVPKYIIELIKQREKVATELVSLDSKLNDWLDDKGVFDKCICGDHSGLFNSGCIELESGSGQITIDYLKKL